MRLKSKRLISLLLAGSMMVSMLPASAVTAFAETAATAVVAENSNTEKSGTCGATESDKVHWNYASGVLTISGTGAMKDYETKGENPDLVVDSHGVITTDNRPWASIAKEIETVKIDEGVTGIGNNAFRSLTALKKANIPASITKLGDNIFLYDENLTDVEWAPGFQAPAETTDTDSNYQKYTGAYVPTGMFDCCYKLGEGRELSSWLPSSFKGIGCGAFRGTQFSVDFDNWSNLKYIGAFAFSNMPNVNKFTLTNKVVLGLRAEADNRSDAFRGSGLKELTVESASVPVYFAQKCNNLSTIVVNGNVEKIDNTAFIECPKLSDVTLNGNINKMGSNIFYDCPSLGTVTLSGPNMKYAQMSSFPHAVTLNVQGGDATSVVNAYFIRKDVYNTTLKSVNIDVNSYTGTESPFRNASALESFTLKATTASLDKTAFVGCSGLKTIDLSQCDKITYKDGCFGNGLKKDAIIYVKDSAAIPPEAVRKEDGWKLHGIVAVVNGGTLPSTLEEGKLATPEKSGCRFVGWYNSADFAGEAVTNPEVGQTYYAKWAEARTVTFDLNGVDGKGPDTQTVYEGDKVTAPKAPTADGYRFDGWYADKNCTAGNEFKFADAEGATTITDNTTVYAKWTPYKTKVEPKVEANADPASKTVEITVNVNADLAELAGATATLNFTDADGNDDSANVVEVKVNGTPVKKNADGKYTANLNDLMNTGKASENGADAMMLADVNAGAVVPGMKNGTALLTVTYKTPGKHLVAIALNAQNGDVICKEIATVEIAPEPGTLNLTGCTATLKDGTPVENGAKVPVGAEVTVTFEPDADSDLVLNGWNVTPETLTDTNGKLVKDITADTFTFKMPETDEGVTIAAQTKTAAPAEDDSLDAATVVTGVVLGTGTAILAYHIGTEVYAEQVLGKGVAIPRTREEVALKAWELAGKPAVELNGEPLSEAAQAEKWAVESGLMQNVDGSFNGSKKMSKLKALRTLDAAKKLG